jgi:hypothetical protein
MKTDYSTTHSTSLAASVAPEDLKCGEYVAVLNEIVELPSFIWLDTVPSERDKMVRIRCIPDGSGVPLKVKAICLPFLFTKSPSGQFETIDVRRAQLVRLNEGYAKTVWKELASNIRD